MAQVEEIASPPERYELRGDLGAAAYDVFCTANLSTYPAWERPVSMLLDIGLNEVQRHDQQLVSQLIDGLPAGWRPRSPISESERSTFVFVEPERPDTVGSALARLDAAGVDAGERTGLIRLSSHLHNTTDDIDRTLAALWVTTRWSHGIPYRKRWWHCWWGAVAVLWSRGGVLLRIGLDGPTSCLLRWPIRCLWGCPPARQRPRDRGRARAEPRDL